MKTVHSTRPNDFLEGYSCLFDAFWKV